MTKLEADLPDKYSLGDSWGIGWIRFGWDGRRLVGHDGNTIVPAAGTFSVDARMWDTAEQARVHAAMSSLLPAVPDAVLQISGGPNRPPLPASSSAGLFSLASSIAARLGLAPLESASVGGASDGNFTAGVGTPTLDGLGAVGGRAHADDEHVLIDALPGRAALLAALIDELLAGGPLPASRATEGTA